MKKNIEELIKKNAIKRFGDSIGDLGQFMEALEELLINDDEGWAKYSPFSDTRVKKPARRMKEYLESLGVIFGYRGAVLNQDHYVLNIITEISHQGFELEVNIVVDYWNRSVRFDDCWDF